MLSCELEMLFDQEPHTVLQETGIFLSGGAKNLKKK